MIFEKNATVRAPVDRVWALLLDPNVMGACVPGVETIEVVSDVEYLVTVQVKVAFISARFKVRTNIVEARAPTYLRSAGTGEDSTLTSSLTQTSEVFLTDKGDGSSELRTRLVVELTGRFGTFGLDIIKTKVDRMWQEFSENLAKKMGESAAAAETTRTGVLDPSAAVSSAGSAGPSRASWLNRLSNLGRTALRELPQRRLATEVNAAPSQAGVAVWLDMDQATLDKAYNQAAYATNRQQLLDRWVTRSNITRALRGNPLRRAYGNSDFEHLDIYPCDTSPAPINIFIHGGAWRLGSASDCGFFADLFNNAGAHLVVPDFINVEQAGGTLFPMVEQVRKSIAWVHANAHTFGGDRFRMYLSGTSSGAHLAAVALTSDWFEYGLTQDVFEGALLCSGIYDLEPVRRSARSAYVRFTDGMVEQLSPQRHLERLNTPLIVVYGSLETPEFQRQSRAFAQAVKERGLTVELQMAEGYNHFEIHETLGDPYDVLGRAVLRQMELQ